MVYYIPTAQILQHINFIKPATPTGVLECGCPPTGGAGGATALGGYYF